MPHIVTIKIEHPLSWLHEVKWSRKFRWRWLAAAYAHLTVLTMNEPGQRVSYTINDQSEFLEVDPYTIQFLPDVRDPWEVRHKQGGRVASFESREEAIDYSDWLNKPCNEISD